VSLFQVCFFSAVLLSILILHVLAASSYQYRSTCGQSAEVIEGINDKIDKHIGPTTEVSRLPCAEGATWNEERVCLPDTRVSILQTIWEWIIEPHANMNAKIFCVASIAGAGKSTLAHSVAKQCYDHEVLGSCFFFDRETADRNTPRKLITTLARELSSLGPGIERQIALAIRREPTIVTSPSIQHQSRKLILEPLSRYPVKRPVAVVIDALDEGYDEELLKLLCKEIPKLPSCLRIFITTHSEKIYRHFFFKPHMSAIKHLIFTIIRTFPI
ncbi:hypothetical protein BDQ17DRAFT_497806, partial [Cyathus striatus]